MIESPIRVTIVTPVHNRRDLTLLCLRSLSRIDKTGLEVRTIIVDDGSTDGTSEAIAEEFPDVELIRADGSLWFTEGTNVGVRAALKHDPKYVVMMNDDQVFDAGFLRSMVTTAESWPQSVVGSLLLLWDTPHKLFQVAPVWETLKGGWRHWYQQTVWTIPKKPFEVDLIVGNCVMVPTEAIRQLGLLDSKRYPNFGDAEYTPRLKKNGWRLIIDPNSRVFCQPNAPQYISRLSLREKVDKLLLDTGHPHNLVRRFWATVDGAPNRVTGALAFIIFILRLAVRRTAEGPWALSQRESTIAEAFKDRVLSR